MNTKGLKQIGRGAFSTVYRKNKNTVLIKSVDPVKECMSFSWFPNTLMFPKTVRVAVLDDEQETQLFEQRYYPKVTSLKTNLLPREWEFYQLLRDISETLTIKDRYNELYKKFEEYIPAKFATKKKHLLHALEVLANYGHDVCFEVSPRNVAVYKGRLVLLDCFFMRSKLDEVRSNKKNRR